MAFFDFAGRPVQGLRPAARAGIYATVFLGGLLALALAWYFLAPAPVVLGDEQAGMPRSIASNGRFEFLFSSRMDAGRTEAAIRFEPELSGNFEWQSGSVLHFLPEAALAEGSEITVTIGATAADWLGKQTGEEVRFIYRVVSPPEITMIAPISAHDWENILSEREGKEGKQVPEAARLKKGEPVTVVFDRPIRSLGATAFSEKDAEALAAFVRFEPEVSGRLAFLGTTAFEYFIDEAAWPYARELKVTIAKGFPTGDGGKTVTDSTFMLRTDAPELLSVRAGETLLAKDEASGEFGGENILPESKIVLTWNMPVELESFYKGLKITPERKIKNDSIIRDEEDPTRVTLEFDPPLYRGETIGIEITANIAPLSGEFRSPNPHKIAFKTLQKPCVKAGGTMADERYQIEPDGAVEVDFCTLMAWRDEKAGRDLDQSEAVKAALRVAPEVAAEKLSVNCSGSVCQIWAPSEPGAELTVSFAEGLKDVFGQEIPAKDGFVTARVKDYPPMVSAMTRGGTRGVYDASEPLVVYFAARNAQSLSFTSCAVPAETVRRIEGKGGYDWYQYSCAEGGRNTETRQVKIPGERNRATVFEVPLLSGGTGEAGTVYFWEAVSPEVLDPWQKTPQRFVGTAIPVNGTLTLKASDDAVTAWATDFAEGKPVKGMEVVLYDENGGRIGSGLTDTDGLTTIKKPSEAANYYAEGTAGALKTVAGSGWNAGIAPWDFGFNYDWRKSPALTGSVFADRPIFRPGDKVAFKGILRRDLDAEYRIPEQKTISVRIENSRGERIMQKDFPLDRFGAFGGDLTLLSEAPTGQYFIHAGSGDETAWEQIVTGAFWVEAYKKPSYDLAIETAKAEFVSGETFAATLKSEYFFGEPVKGAQIKWHIVATPLYFDRWSGGGWYSFGTDEQWCWWGCPQAETVAQRGEGVSSEKGELAIELPLKTDTHQLYTLYATATDSAGQTVSANRSLPVFSADFALGVRGLDFWLDRDAPTARAEVIASNLDGSPLLGQAFTAKLQQTKWNSIKKQDVDGNYYWENTQEFVTLETQSGQTGSEGKAEISFSLKDEAGYFGELRLLIEAIDAKGNAVAAADRVWRSREAGVYAGKRENNDRITLQLEKNEIKPGETISLLPLSPFTEPVWAMISVDRKGGLSQKVQRLEPGQPLELKSTDEMIPNAFVSVVLAKGKGGLASIYDRIVAYHDSEAAITQLSAKRDELQKNQESLLKSLSGVESRLGDALRKGVDKTQADLAAIRKQIETATADKAAAEQDIRAVIGESAEIPPPGTSVPRPEIKIGISPIRVSPESKRLHIEIEPMQKEYLPGSEATLKAVVKDAYGNPVENADLSLAVVDASLLALKTRQDEDIFDVFFRLRDIGVQFSSTLVYLIDRLDIAGSKGTKGGGGGGDLDLLKKKRGEFRDTAHWEQSRQTDITGTAEFSFRLPDNITEWQAWVTAHTLDSRFGSAKANFYSRKPLVVTPVVPRFLVVGDTAEVSALVHNRTDYEMIVTTDFKAENAEIVDGQPEGFRLAAGKERTVSFTIKASGSGEGRLAQLDPAVITINAKGEAENAVDMVSVNLPVIAPVLGETIATAGLLAGERNAVTEKIGFPTGVLPGLGKIFISASPGAIGDLSGAFSALIAFPYGCAEQLASAIIPDLLLLDLAARPETAGLIMTGRDPEAIRRQTAENLQRLYELQNSDGGFVFFPGSTESYPFLSAYALFALEIARATGIAVEERALTAAREYVRLKLWEDFEQAGETEKPFAYPNPDTRAFAAYTLSFGPQFDEGAIARLTERLADLSAEGKGYLLLTLLRVDREQYADQIATLVRQLESEAKQTDRLANVSGSENAYNFSSDIRATAVVFDAILMADADHPLLPKMLAWLNDQKKAPAAFVGGPWGTTQNSAWVILAMADYVKQHPPAAAEVRIAFNDREIAKGTIEPGKPALSAEIPLSEARGQFADNTVDLAATGGEVAYDLTAQFFVSAEQSEPFSLGFGIFRSFYAYDDRAFEKPLSAVKQGEIVRGKVTVLVPENRSFAGVTVPLPAGLEGINFSLENEDASLQTEAERCGREWCSGFENGSFTYREFRDDRIFFFAPALAAGRYELTFLARASTAGEFSLLPATAEAIYRPEIFGRTEGQRFRVEKAGKAAEKKADAPEKE